MLIYKILRSDEWRAFEAAARTSGARVDLADGYIHFSTAEQLPGTAARHFAGEAGLELVAADAEALGDALRWEPSRGGALFPHLYRELERTDVVWQAPLPFGAAERLTQAALSEFAGAGHVDPYRSQLDASEALPRGSAIEMLNLVRFRARAAYPEGHPAASDGLSGAEAYARYSAAAAPTFMKVGGTIAWRGRFEALLIGPELERWDAAFIARYPGADAFLAMITDPAYQAAVIHRQAATLTSRLLRFAPAEAGTGYW